MIQRVLRPLLLVPVCVLIPACGEYLAVPAWPERLPVPACGEHLALPAVFSDHAVFQRGRPIPVWGTADPGRRVLVRFAEQSKGAVAGDQGQWRVRLDPLPAGGPYKLTVTVGLTRLERQDILVGEVWVCSGQSNMEWPLSRARNAEQEIADANCPRIRLFTVPRKLSDLPEPDVEGQWVACTPETAATFSAVGYFFGRHLEKELDAPVGLINSSWGGSRAESWTPRWYLERDAGFADMLAEWDARWTGPEGTFADRLRAHEKAMREYEDRLRQFLSDLAPRDAGLAGQWQRPDLDANGWTTMDLPQPWEQGGLAGVDGIVWFRRELAVPDAWAGKDLLLELGPIDEGDITYFNGVPVGATDRAEPRSAQKPRRYLVPGKCVRPGRNVLACRVLDLKDKGGFVGKPEQMRLARPGAPAEEALPLAGAWKVRVGHALQAGEAPVAPRPPGGQGNVGMMYNAMIAPLVPYGIAGAIWYQGESNAGKAVEYRTLFPKMIDAWRRRWDQGDFPFLFVQLANFLEPATQPAEGGWAWVREAQAMALSLPKTGMAVTTDIGEAKDIHPRNKQDVGKRLGLAALHVAYGRDVVWSGPIYESMETESDKVRLHFRHVDGGLLAKDGPLKQFAIAGEDRNFVWAEAKIDGNSVVVWSDKVAKPVAVRYAWANNPEGCNLYNAEMLPASPFRTDDWPAAEPSKRK